MSIVASTGALTLNGVESISKVDMGSLIVDLLVLPFCVLNDRHKPHFAYELRPRNLFSAEHVLYTYIHKGPMYISTCTYLIARHSSTSV